MNEGPMPGYSPSDNAYEYDAYSTGSYQAVGTAFSPGYDAYGRYDGSDAYGGGYGYTYAPEYGTGYDTTGTYAMYDPYAYGAAQPTQQTTGTAYYDTGTYDSTALWPGAVPQQAPSPQQTDWDSGGYPAYGHGYGYGYDANGDTGIYEQLSPPAATQPSQAYQGHEGYEGYDGHEGYERYEAAYEAPADPYPTDAHAEADPYAPEDAYTPEADDEHVRHDYAPDGPAAGGTGNGGVPAARSRRRKPAKRSALLTIAVPSVAVMGVAAVGAAAIGGVGMAQGSSSAQTDAQASGGSQPTTQLDRQLSGVSRDADDFATRASRTQQRLDLKDRQAAAAKAKREEEARKEALRPKYVLPVTQKGLSAYFGQAGEHWMMLHTGIDFPVQVGTPVMAATDGTVRTQWNPSYGNMAIVTAPDGTETWYCHLSSTKIRSGSVKAGTVIAYSGNTGNTTGPHLHFEVRPGGGQPIDPLPWLLSHGLDPR